MRTGFNPLVSNKYEKNVYYSDVFRNTTMDDKLIYTPNDKENYPLCGLKLLFEKFGHLQRTNQNLSGVPKLCIPTRGVKLWVPE